MTRIVLAMSGGVDSSVAAGLLQRQGHEVIGVFMRHGYQPPLDCLAPTPLREAVSGSETQATHKQGCCSVRDADDARRVADQLDIPFYAVDFQSGFDRIVTYFVDEYVAGRTPNPCVMCNTWLKFGKLFEYADSVGADAVATGHYARIVSGGAGGPGLYRGVDHDKDQSYALFGVSRDLLDRMLLPIGTYSKPQIRTLARDFNLRVAAKRESQEICFVPPGQHARFVRQQRPAAATAGRFVTVDGRVVGHHSGIEGFTVGQRKGLGIALGEPHFVVRIDAETNDVIIGPQAALARQELTARDTNWLADVPARPFTCRAKIRYNSPPAAATAERLGDGRVRVVFAEPRYGVAPGQAVVCYESDRLLGGGWIE